ncbi:TraC family protein [Ancylobacter sp.]|uniref:TraC family protein n=1 Tax=Ancylobacter sp. TaxID=1872567 RepID=UPI003C7ABC68
MSRIRSASRMTSIDEVDTQIQELQRKRKELQAQRAERLGRLAMSTGLGDLNLSDEAIKAAFSEVAARFRPSAITPELAATTTPAELFAESRSGHSSPLEHSENDRR